MKPHVVLSIPKRKGRKLTRVTATLMDWSVQCEDAEVAAQVEQVKPENRGYLPFQELAWARECERWLLACVVSVHPLSSDGPEIPGVCFSPMRTEV